MRTMTAEHHAQVGQQGSSTGGTGTIRGGRRRQGFQQVALGVAVAFLALTSTILVAGTVAKARLKAQYPPTGQLLDVGGYRLHLACQGSGGPTVILEAGAGSFSLHWARVQPELAKTGRVCAYDRAGYGWSDRSPRPRTASVMAEELATLLRNADIRGPYVLAGHSLGGPIIRQFAHAHQRDVVGMVLVDSAHETQIARFPEPIRNAQGRMTTPLRLMKLAAGAGILALKPSILALPLPGDTAVTAQALVASSSKHLATFLDETTAAGEERTPPVTTLGDIPLVVIRHGRVDLAPSGAVTPAVIAQYEATWVQLQRELATLSPRGKLVVAERSGHDIHLEQPELVIGAIQDVLAASR